MRACLWVVIFCFIRETATAKIGETRTQIEARFGQATEADGDSSTYVKGAFRVVVNFSAGSSITEIVSRLTEPGTAPPKFSDNEVTTLLAAYGDGVPWAKAFASSNWTRGDKRVYAELATDGTNLRFADLVFLAGLQKQKENELAQQKAIQNQAESRRVADAFGPIPTVAPTPPPAPAVVWRTPYPAEARMAHVMGTVKLRYSTDGSGNISSVSITTSSGSDILDKSALAYAKMNWHGPPNSSSETELKVRENSTTRYISLHESVVETFAETHAQLIGLLT